MTALLYSTIVGVFTEDDIARTPLVGQVTITRDTASPGQSPVLMLVSETPPRTIAVDPVVVALDVTGALSVTVPGSGQVGVTVPSVFTYFAKFNLSTAAGVRLSIPSFHFTAAGSSTVDLAVVAPAAVISGTGFVVGPTGPPGPPGPGGGGSSIVDNGDGTFTA